jgi:hypothetical protein
LNFTLSVSVIVVEYVRIYYYSTLPRALGAFWPCLNLIRHHFVNLLVTAEPSPALPQEFPIASSIIGRERV